LGLVLLLLIVERPPEEHDVWLRAMNRIVDPPTALLDPDRAPLVLHQNSLKTYQKSNPCIPTRTQIIGLQNFKEGEKNKKKISETLILHTSERSRFLGSCFATSGGSTTWLKAQIRDKISQQTKGGKRKSVEEEMVTALPVLVGVVEILVGVLDLTHFSL
jgi:hypothetical protein